MAADFRCTVVPLPLDIIFDPTVGVFGLKACPSAAAAALQQALLRPGRLADAGGGAVLRHGDAGGAAAHSTPEQPSSSAEEACGDAPDAECNGAAVPGSAAEATATLADQRQDQPGGSGGGEAVLDLVCGGVAVVSVGVALRSGRLLLRVGAEAAAESRLDLEAFNKQVTITCLASKVRKMGARLTLCIGA